MRFKILHTAVFAVVSGALVAANLVADYYNKQITEILEPSTTITQDSTDTKEVCQDIAEEGAVLLKNDANVLPFGKIGKINLFGYGSTALVFGGSGSGAVNTSACTTLVEAFAAAGIENNDDLTAQYLAWAKNQGLPSDGSHKSVPIYNSDWSIDEPPVTQTIYRAANLESCLSFSQYAIFTMNRVSGEGTDLPKGEKGDGTVDYLAMTDTEKKVIALLEETFGDKLIVLLNSANPIEIAPLDDLGVKTVISMPGPGQYGLDGLVNLLVGEKDGKEISFSGRLAATYEVDHSTNPSYYTSGKIGTHYYTGGSTKAYVDYSDGLYVGYRYYETRALDEGEDWYKEEVLYPFGYGLSYTAFEQTIKSVSRSAIAGDVASGDEISVVANVKNTGGHAGKDAVQLYVTKPYASGGIEKSAVDLLDYGKTSSLAPGESEDVTLAFTAKDLASFDYNDANGNDFEGYELEKGNYVLSLRSDAHNIITANGAKQTSSIRVSQDYELTTDETTGAEIKPLFAFAEGDGQNIKYLSRDTWSLPKYASTARAATSDVINNDSAKLKADAFDGDSQYGDVLPTMGAHTDYELGWDYTAAETKANDEKADIRSDGGNYSTCKKTLVEWDDTAFDDPLWDKLLDQMSAGDYATLINGGGYQTAEIDSINKSMTKDVDGPQGLKLDQGGVGTNSSYGTAFPCEMVVAQTYNKSLAHDYGTAIGKEGVSSSVTGWYGPALNIQRNAYEGRYYEYMSEDPIITGYQTANMVKGSLQEGMRPYIKHFALNEQENERSNIVTWCNEQALREVYLKAFEICVKVGGANCVMSSFNDIGPIWAGACKPLLTDLLRTEWGFHGMVLTDYYADWMPMDAAVRAGNDIALSPTQHTNLTLNGDNVGQTVVARQCCKDILYAITRSLATVEIASRESWPKWIVAGVAADCVVSALLLTYLGFAWFYNPKKKKKKDGAAAVEGNSKIAINKRE